MSKLWIFLFRNFFHIVPWKFVRPQIFYIFLRVNIIKPSNEIYNSSFLFWETFFNIVSKNKKNAKKTTILEQKNWVSCQRDTSISTSEVSNYLYQLKKNWKIEEEKKTKRIKIKLFCAEENLHQFFQFWYSGVFVWSENAKKLLDGWRL